MTRVLFEIKEGNLETGLRGYPCGYCTTSMVDPIKGLFYVGHPIASLVEKRPIEVIYLLYHGKEGSGEEVKAFEKLVQEHAYISNRFFESLACMPRGGDAMQLFASALLYLGMTEKKGDYREDALSLIAKIPSVAAAVINHHAGWSCSIKTIGSGYMEHFDELLGCPKQEHLAELFRLFEILHLDHDGGNLSTFVGKAVASGLEDLWGSLAAAMLALAGPRHGKASQEVLTQTLAIQKELGDHLNEERLEEWIRQKLAKGGTIFGFGHAVLRTEDARAMILFEKAKQWCPDHPLVRIALMMRTCGTKVLKENPKIKNPYPNVDAISGVLLAALGFNYPPYFPLLFGLARVVGISLQIVYERCEARGGKGTPIVRPTYIYRDRKELVKQP